MNLKPEQIVAMQHVTRWHARFSSRPQSVAEHSHQVALLALYLAPESLSVEDRLTMVTLALVHDAHECVFGDIPYPAKKALEADDLDLDQILADKFWGVGANPADAAPPHVRLVVDVADRLEAALYAQAHLPEIAMEVTRKAVRAAGLGLCAKGFAKALAALGVMEGGDL